ncbi:MAG TPA: DUF4340 domain-containing protein [Chloroflexota bacterium]
MNPRLTAGLVALFVVLAAAVWWLELRSPEAAVKPAGQAPVFDLKPDDVSRIEVDDSGKTVTAERTEGGWRLVQPAGEADAARVEGAVGQVAKLNATRKLEDASDPASYGLSSPTSRLLLGMKDGSSQELLIGSKTPDQASYYVKRADSPAIFVTATFALGDLMRWPSDPPRPRPSPTPGALPSQPPPPAAKPAP